MSYAQKEDLFAVSGTKVSERVFSADFTSDAVETRNLHSGSVWVDWKDGSATDATVKIQEGPTSAGPWADRTSGSATLSVSSATPTAKKIPVSDVDSPYMRVVGTANSETTAKTTVRYYFKGAR